MSFQIGTCFRLEQRNVSEWGGGLPTGFIGDASLDRQPSEQNPDREAQVTVQGEGGEQRQHGVDAERPEETRGHGEFILAWGGRRFKRR